MMERTVIRLNTCNEPIYNCFEASLQVFFPGGVRVADSEGSQIGAFTLLGQISCSRYFISNICV